MRPVEKGRGTGDQIVNIHWIMEKPRKFQKNIYFCFTDYFKPFDCVDHNKLWEILKEVGVPDHLTCLLRNVYAGQEATVRTRHGTMNWFKIGKKHDKAVCCHSVYLTYKPSSLGFAGGADDTTLMTKSEEELKNLLIKVKEKSEKAGLKLNIQKTKIMASSPITSWQIDGEKVQAVTDFIFWGSKITADGD